MVVRGSNAHREGKVTGVYRKRWTVTLDRFYRDKASGQQHSIPFRPSNVGELFEEHFLTGTHTVDFGGQGTA